MHQELINPRFPNRFQPRGFTLIEVLIVIGMMAILSVFLVPNLLGNFAEVNLNTDQKVIGGVLRNAQERAQTREGVTSGSDWSVCVDPSLARYALRQGDCSTGILTATFSLNNSVVFDSLNAQAVTFIKGTGTASPGGVFRIQNTANPTNQYRDVRVEPNGAILY